jgi:SAM-dependent methyltransferase
MAQITTGIRAILGSPKVYDLLQDMMGARPVRKKLVDDYIRPFRDCRILDIGCGTARILDFLPSVSYFGFDLSQDYISEAQRRYSGRGEFTCGLVEQATVEDMDPFDVVLAVGVLHHLSDLQSQELMNLAYRSLKRGGRLITIDPCFTTPQNFMSRFLISKDRGQNVREAQDYKELPSGIFTEVTGEIKHRQWIPYTHYYMTCIK